MKSILKKIYTNLRKKAIEPYTYSERYVKLDDVYDEIFKAEKEYNEKCIAEIRNKAIDEFAEKIELGISESVIWDTLANANKNSSLSDTSDRIFDYVVETIKDLAEQMKGV